MDDIAPSGKLLRRAVIVGIDGTLAQPAAGRRQYEHDRVIDDTPVNAVIEVVEALVHQSVTAVFITGRPESWREVTEAWLDEHLDIRGYRRHLFAGPFMRADDDDLPEADVKHGLYGEHVKGRYDVIGVFDDGPRVVGMWRDLGLTVYGVAGGEF